MLTRQITFNVPKIIKRNIGISAPALQKASDPIQQLFLDKIREYRSKSSGGQLVEPTPEIENEKKSELERIAKQFGGKDLQDMEKFPTFKFTDPPVDTGLKGH